MADDKEPPAGETPPAAPWKLKQISAFNLSAWALTHRPLVNYLMAVLLIGGVFAFFALGQDEDPPFTFRAMVVRAFWPGATAQQMAEQVTDKLERKLQEAPYADKIRSYSKPGETLIILQLKDYAPPRDIAQTWYQVRKKIGDIRGTLPAGVQGPFFNDEFGDVYGVIFAFAGDGFSAREMKDYVDWARQQLLKVPDVAKVDLFGVQDERVTIEIAHQRLAQLGLTAQSLAEQLGTQNAVEGAGVLALPTDNVQIRVSGALARVEDLAQLPIRANGLSYKLGDVARVYRGYLDPPREKMRAGHRENGSVTGGEVIGLGISMAKGGDIVALGRALAVAEKQLEAALPVGVEMFKVADQPRSVTRSVNEFIRVLIEAVVVVLAVSFVSLGLHRKPGSWRFTIDMRPGLVVALTIPLVLAVTFLAMYVAGINLHKISLGALIVALGLLVDDAIIAVEMVVRKMEEGYDRFRAATAMFELTAMPMLTGTLITATGFLPIALAKSTAGEYTLSIFQVTAISLVISWFVAVLFVPQLSIWFLRIKPRVGAEGVHELFDTPFYQRFRRLVNWCIEWRKTVIAITLGALALGVVGFRYIEQQFFPDSNRLELVVDMWLPEGSSFAATEGEALRFERWLRKQPQVEYYAGYVGTGSPRFYLSQDQQFPQSNLGQYIVMTRSLEDRQALRLAMLQLFRDDFPNLRGRVKLLPNGPPVAYPVQFRVEGEDPALVRATADRIKAMLRANPNTVGANDNWNEQVKALKLTIDQDRARALGVSSQLIARAAQTILSGTVIGQFREGDELIDIVLRQPYSERDTIARLADANMPTASGRYVPLSQLVKAEFGWEPGVIWRENRNYAITVQSEVKDGIQGPTVTTQVWDSAPMRQLRAELPTGYRVVVAGATEESAKAGTAIAMNLPLALFIIFTLLMLQLASFSRSLLVFLTGPLGFIGAAGALLLMQRPFGFVAQLGVIALIGMIIRNAVILIDQIERDEKLGVETWTAIVEAAVRRFRPIMLTAAAAVLAMIPLSRSVFWGPMAVAIMGGLIIATVLTLLFLPALYAAWFRVKRGDTHLPVMK